MLTWAEYVASDRELVYQEYDHYQPWSFVFLIVILILGGKISSFKLHLKG